MGSGKNYLMCPKGPDCPICKGKGWFELFRLDGVGHPMACAEVMLYNLDHPDTPIVLQIPIEELQ